MIYEKHQVQLLCYSFSLIKKLNWFSETGKLLKIRVTLPLFTVENEGCFSPLYEVKTFLQNTIGQR